ncbi:unnamed protein product (macronuclear) [Paramecium tetraurelia]|uniref:Protein kinase domain-containing protein n=1 Tax=Paramecium tetraurelia TaxID=5888 RepID=A0E5V5_PARTE|nr:uncharacterized protein GSPATT00003535001 [Paramecium tetraurelia]CAK90672.1 unnamed protein product [Paramecium tetraurelia]|eukprot:XP_001458069.1 hypothetical protein (macronuclear) [Paramecium tetraurelia strain d4-2]
MGNGKYGKIVMAKHQLVNEKVCIKILEKKNLKFSQDFENLENEIQILRQVKHPNVIHLYEILESTSNIYMIFEYGEGNDLKHRLNQSESLIYLQQIAKGVSYLHENNIIHYKLRLGNIVLQNGRPKIIDFSEAIKIEKQKDKDYSIIKLPYQSPEMLNSLYYEFDGEQYDIWCLGLILYQMLQGQLPFDNTTNNNDLKSKIKKSKFQINYPISQQVCSLLEAMLNADPNKRIKLNELNSYLGTQNLQFEDDYLKVPVDIPMHVIIQELENYQLETVNLFQLLEQNKHCTLTTCYYLIKNKLMKLAKLKKVKLNLMNFENSKFNFMTNLRNSIQFATKKCRIYQNATRVHTENNKNRSESFSQNVYQYKSLSRTNNRKVSIVKQTEQSPKQLQTQNSFFPSQNSPIIDQYNNNIHKGSYNQNLNKQEIINDNYSMYQDKQQQRIRNVLFPNKNFIIQDKNKKRRSTSQKI